MSLLNSSLAGANYMTSNNEDRETSTNGAAEFTRRKKWPEILLKELVGGSIFCLKPVQKPSGPDQQPHQGGSSSGPSPGSTWGWKIVYSSPAVYDMLGQKPAELEGKDFLELVSSADHPQIHSFFLQLLQPPLPHHASSSSVTTMTVSSASQAPAASNAQSPAQGESQTTYIRMLGSAGSSSKSNTNTATANSSTNDTSSSSEASTPSRIVGPVVWEVRGHATGIGEEANTGAENNTGTENFGLPNQGTVMPQGQAQNQSQGPSGLGSGSGSGSGGNEGGMKGKAIWIMGRRVGENQRDDEGNGGSGSSNGPSTGNSNGSGNGPANGQQSLDAFLELKLENERLREELRELQLDLDEDLPPRKSSYPNISPTNPSYVPSSSPSSSSSSAGSSRSSSPSRANLPSASGAGGSASKPKIKSSGRPPKTDAIAKEKRRKKSAAGMVGKGEGEGMHVCVTCGRTDSPEWRKGPLGPKTLCNACGLRWAKRNSAQPTRKDRKPDIGKK